MPETKQIITIYYSFGGCMRKHIKEKIITLAATVEEAGHYIVDCMERGQAVQSESVLEDVRQSALRMAEIVAQSEGEGHPAVKQLRKHCDLIAQCSLETEDEDRKRIAESLLEGWEKIEEGLPVLATCAGLILLAQNVSNDEKRGFATLPVTVKRNAYGRQLGSFYYEGGIKGIGTYPMEFIRAPYIESVGDDVEILAEVEEKIVGVAYKNQLAFSFHPELTGNDKFHEKFLELIKVSND